MEERNKNVVTYIGAGIIILLLIGLFITIGSNVKNKKTLKEEKLASEKLLSEKLMVEKEIEKIKADFNTLKVKNDATAKLLEETNMKISENQKKISSLTGENKALRTRYAKEIADLQNTKTALEQEFSKLKSENEKLTAATKELKSSLDKLEATNKNLAQQLEKTQIYNTDNFLVTATRGKKTEKMVVKATRTKKLNITFEVPKSLTEAINFKIVTPSGTTINPDDKAMSWNVLQDSRQLTASLSAYTGEFEESKQVALTYSPKQKLVTGEYKIQILCNSNIIGTCRIKLK